MQAALAKVELNVMNPTVKYFIENILTINELDYGDFMRKANHYLLELEDKVAVTADPAAVVLLANIKLHLQYYPNWNIEQTRKLILDEVAKINDHI